MASLTFEPVIAPSLWVALLAAGAVVLSFYGMRRPGVVSKRRWGAIVALMGGALACVLAVLLNPTWVEELPPPAGRPLLTVLVDDSGSMGTADESEGKSRYTAAAEAAKRLSDALADRFEVRMERFSDAAATSVGADELAKRKPDGKSTDLAAAIASCLKDDRPQGQAIALLSDGIQTAPGGLRPVLESAQSARAMAAPIYAATYGGDAGGMDLAIDLRWPQDLTFVKQKAPIVAVVSHRGINQGMADVSLWHEGKQIDRQSADLSAAGPVTVRFSVSQEKPGVYSYQLRLGVLPGEITGANNAASYLLRVVDRPVRVLMLEGKPYWDSKFMMRTLSQMPAVEVDSVVRLAEGRLIRRSVRQGGEAATQPATAPATPVPGGQADWQVLTGAGELLEKPGALQGYQILVLGRDAEPFLTAGAVANLQKWISREGGALVCYRGAPAAVANERLARLLPVTWSASHETRFRMRFTEPGRELRWLGTADEQPLLEELPTLASSAPLARPKPLAVVLAGAVSPDGQESAAVVYQPYGTGRTIVIEGAGMWRWAFLPPQSQQVEEAYQTLWQSALRWLVSGVGLLPGQAMALRCDSTSFGPASPATATLLLREERTGSQVPSVELRGAGKKLGEFAPVAAGDAPGTYRVDFGKLPEGQYEAIVAGAAASDAAARTAFDVRAVGAEQLDLKARPELMARIAADSGGAVVSGEASGQILKHFQEHMARLRPPRVQRSSAWDRWWVMGLIVVAWGCCWMSRRLGGLV